MFGCLIRRNNNNSNTNHSNLFAPMDEKERIFEEAFNDPFFKPMNVKDDKEKRPMNVIDVKENGKTVAKRLEWAIAGFRKDEISLSLKDDILTIEAEHKRKCDENEIPEYNGIFYKKMSMSYALMDNADKERITSQFSNGLLVATIPLKKEDAQTVE